MAMARILLSLNRHRHRSISSSSFPPSPLFSRWLSSDSNPNPNPNAHPHPTTNHTDPPRQFVPIQPVSYAVKPRDPPPPLEHEMEENQSGPRGYQQNAAVGEQEQEAFRRTEWTRADIRYVKEAPSISPISYPARVAPLPEDRAEGAGEGAAGDRAARPDSPMPDSGMESERRAIESRRNMFYGMGGNVEEEKKNIPFPRLIVPVKREKKPIFDLIDAIRKVKENGRKTFDETVEAHVRLGVDKSRSDLIVRGTMSLPHGEKKILKIAFFAEGRDAEEAREAGADVVGGIELIDEIASSGKINFDKCFTTPKLYPRVAKLAKILNRHGIMPDYKQGTVVTGISKAVNEAKQNQIKFRMDKTSIVHVGLGKVSFTDESLRENVAAFMNALLLAKPAGLKKTSKFSGYVNSFHICSTMGPSFPVSMQSLSQAVDRYNNVL